MTGNKKAIVMIVDDEPRNLDVLEAMLRHEDYEVAAFPRGDFALAAAPDIKPDLLLLDIRMPDLDGYEVCRRFKDSPVLKDIPVIFLSALSETPDKVLAFEAGGVDYISKPLNRPEVLARVRAHLALRRQSLLLEELVRRRTKELESAHRRLSVLDAAKTQWINTLAHEIRGPLTGIICTADVLFRGRPEAGELAEMRSDYDASCSRIKKLINDAATLAAVNAGGRAFDYEALRVADVLAGSVAAARLRAGDVQFAMSRCGCKNLQTVASLFFLEKAFEDLLVTAACCTPSGRKVTAGLAASEDAAVVCITTQGEGLPQEDLATFFDIGGQRSPMKSGADFGLGQAVAASIIRLFGGSASVRNGDKGGIVIEVRLPVVASGGNGRHAGELQLS